jgi:ubiquinone/menaquinone biosynthesis C-methylase UbiE
MVGYVHGYSGREANRLQDQADTLADLLHAGIGYPSGSRVLEVGCGVDAQTGHLATASPQAGVVAVDISADSVVQARSRVTALAGSRAQVTWCRADLFDLPFTDSSVDHVFVCFVLEVRRDQDVESSARMSSVAQTRARAGNTRVMLCSCPSA